jgi:hypothetical protein
LDKQFLIGLSMAMLAGTDPVAGQEAETGDQLANNPSPVDFLQVWVGAIDTDDDFERTDPVDGSDLSGDFGTVPYFGGGVQRLWGSGLLYGYEGGGLVAFKNDSTKFFGNNGGVRIEIDNTLFSAEVYMGPVLSVAPTRWARVYAAGGPTIAYAYLSDDDEDVTPDDQISASSSSVDFSSGGHSVSVTYYGRAGIEFETPTGVTFGAHARYAPHEFDFDDGGELKLDSVQYFVSVGARL